jgi:ABC-type molybdate transport system substrate-binding protein
LLAADAKTPAKLVAEGLARGVFTYAVGRLVLWSANVDLVDGEVEVLAKGGFDKLAVANPKTAPYGAAALQVLEAKGFCAALAPKLVQGDKVAQTYQFVVRRNAALGFVALSRHRLEPNSNSAPTRDPGDRHPLPRKQRPPRCAAHPVGVGKTGRNPGSDLKERNTASRWVSTILDAPELFRVPGHLVGTQAVDAVGVKNEGAETAS